MNERAMDILMATVLDAGIPLAAVICRRSTAAAYPTKCLAVKRMRDAGISWPVLSRSIGYAHHSQAMHALRRFKEMETDR
jgi:uncharacterized membrane protein YhaH (DUF805 family)